MARQSPFDLQPFDYDKLLEKLQVGKRPRSHPSKGVPGRAVETEDINDMEKLNFQRAFGDLNRMSLENGNNVRSVGKKVDFANRNIVNIGKTTSNYGLGLANNQKKLGLAIDEQIVRSAYVPAGNPLLPDEGRNLYNRVPTKLPLMKKKRGIGQLRYDTQKSMLLQADYIRMAKSRQKKYQTHINVDRPVNPLKGQNNLMPNNKGVRSIRNEYGTATISKLNSQKPLSERREASGRYPVVILFHFFCRHYLMTEVLRDIKSLQ